jgi:hypothetical protein
VGKRRDVVPHLKNSLAQLGQGEGDGGRFPNGATHPPGEDCNPESKQDVADRRQKRKVRFLNIEHAHLNIPYRGSVGNAAPTTGTVNAHTLKTHISFPVSRRGGPTETSTCLEVKKAFFSVTHDT